MSLHMVDSVDTDFFLIKIEHGSNLYGHAIGTLSEVVGRIAEQEYASREGKEAEVIDVWHLSYGMPMLVHVEFKRHDPIGFVEVIFTWDQGNPHTRKITSRRESGYFKISEA